MGPIVVGTTVKLSILDLAPVAPDSTVADSFKSSVRLAQMAERANYERIWYAEHHNMATIASSATAVLISHIAHHTNRIRLGSGGIMLPNHSPLVIAEQFGTLAEIFGDRIDLGLGRPQAPTRSPSARCAVSPTRPTPSRTTCWSCRPTWPMNRASPPSGRFPGPAPGAAVHPGLLAVRREAGRAAGPALFLRFPLRPGCPAPGGAAVPGRVHPSEQLDKPYVIAGVGVLAADSTSAPTS